ncbi:MAG TPA: hypothetical protein O0X23_05540 [Methanocorpusculum sp.]|nr:hypothetical protein [Methanocorpusculum sp.]
MEFYNEADVRDMKKTHPETPDYNNRGSLRLLLSFRRPSRTPRKKYLNIRKQINKFNAEYPYTTEKITEAIVPEVREMIEEWSVSKHCEANRVMKEE